MPVGGDFYVNDDRDHYTWQVSQFFQGDHEFHGYIGPSTVERMAEDDRIVIEVTNTETGESDYRTLYGPFLDSDVIEDILDYWYDDEGEDYGGESA